MRVLILLCVLRCVTGCANGGAEAIRGADENEILILKHSPQSPGYKRVLHIMEFHGPGVKTYLQERGYPDFLSEFKEGGRHCANFYYVNENAVVVFKELNERPDSFALAETRGMNDFERGKLEGKAPTRGLSRPPYPGESWLLREEGTVGLMLWVLADGSVGEAKVEQSSGYPRLDQAAATHALTWRFIPGKDDGKAIAMHHPMKVKFSLDDYKPPGNSK